MKLKNVFCLGLLTSVLIGCGYSKEEIEYKTAENLKKPEIIGSLPDGRIIQRVWVNTRHHAHAVYFFIEGGQEITVNYPVYSGKTTRNEVIVLLDGIPVSTNIIDK
jgi:hypothetical protein